MTVYPFLGEGSPTKIEHWKKSGTLLTSLLEDLAGPSACSADFCCLRRLQAAVPQRSTRWIGPPSTRAGATGGWSGGGPATKVDLQFRRV